MEREIVRKLQQEILAMQGIVPRVQGSARDTGLGPVTEAFPNGVFPVGIHEFRSNSPENAAATSGFTCGSVTAVRCILRVCGLSGFGPTGSSSWTTESRPICRG
jgi:hypothetical protein